MLLLLIGTIAQRDIGIYIAHERYFGSFIFFLGPVPLPGGYSLLSAIFVNLLARLFFSTPWARREHLGTTTVHLGALLLLLGGAITAVTTEEGAMVIDEAQASSVIHDYQKLELVVFSPDTDGEDTSGEPLLRIDDAQLAPGHSGRIAPWGMTLSILDFCRHCRLVRWGEDEAVDEERRGFCAGVSDAIATVAEGAGGEYRRGEFSYCRQQ